MTVFHALPARIHATAVNDELAITIRDADDPESFESIAVVESPLLLPVPVLVPSAAGCCGARRSACNSGRGRASSSDCSGACRRAAAAVRRGGRVGRGRGRGSGAADADGGVEARRDVAALIRHAGELERRLRGRVDARVLVQARSQIVDASVAHGRLRKTGAAIDASAPIDRIETVGLARNGANSADRGERRGFRHFARLRHCRIGQLQRTEHCGVAVAAGRGDARLRRRHAGALGRVAGGVGLARIQVGHQAHVHGTARVARTVHQRRGGGGEQNKKCNHR